MERNYYSLLMLRVLKKIIDILTDSFLVLYFLQLSSNNIIPLGIYNIIQFTVTFICIFSLRNIIKTKYRINLLRGGIFFNFLFFLLILLLKEQVIKYIWLVAIVYGLEEGLYYSVFNIYESNVPKDKMAKYLGTYSWVNSILSIIIPLIFGGVMSYKGFSKCTIIVLILVIIKLILSFFYKDKKVPQGNIIKLKEFYKLIKKEKSLSSSFNWIFTNGLTYSGAFKSIVTIYIIKQFQTGFSLGIITSILAVITAISGYIFANALSTKHYKNTLKISYGLTIITLIVMVFKCNVFTIVLFNFVQSVVRVYFGLIDWNNCLKISNNYNDMKEEFFIFNELYIYIGRIISYIFFCILAICNTALKTNIIMIIFILFIVYRFYCSIKLQNCFER